jgi:hypothetical protein
MWRFERIAETAPGSTTTITNASNLKPGKGGTLRRGPGASATIKGWAQCDFASWPGVPQPSLVVGDKPRRRWRSNADGVPCIPKDNYVLSIELDRWLPAATRTSRKLIGRSESGPGPACEKPNAQQRYDVAYLRQFDYVVVNVLCGLVQGPRTSSTTWAFTGAAGPASARVIVHGGYLTDVRRPARIESTSTGSTRPGCSPLRPRPGGRRRETCAPQTQAAGYLYISKFDVR